MRQGGQAQQTRGGKQSSAQHLVPADSGFLIPADEVLLEGDNVIRGGVQRVAFLHRLLVGHQALVPDDEAEPESRHCQADADPQHRRVVLLVQVAHEVEHDEGDRGQASNREPERHEPDATPVGPAVDLFPVRVVFPGQDRRVGAHEGGHRRSTAAIGSPRGACG